MQSPSQMQDLVRRSKSLQEANIYEGNTTPQKEVELLSGLDLTTARLRGNEFAIGFPFRSIYVRDASDSSTELFLLLNTQDTWQPAIRLRKNDVFTLSAPTAKAWLYWAAQSGKTVDLQFTLTSVFSPGNFLVSNTSGLDGTAIASDAKGGVTTSAAILVAGNTSRKQTTVFNDTGATMYIGGSGVTLPAGANPGIPIFDQQSFVWKNTAALYVIAAGAVASKVYMMTES